MSKFKLIVTDIDGCIGRGEGQPYELETLAHLARMNRAAQQDWTGMAVTLCSGRPAAYVDAMMQVINGFLPAVYENGAGLYFPKGYRFVWNPAIPAAARRTLVQTRELLDAAIVRPGVGYFQPGKEMSLTLLAMPGYSLDQVGHAVRTALEGKNLPCITEISVSTVEIRLPGLDKGTGVKWLASEIGISLTEMVGVGDARGDLVFLNLLGASGTPANAEDDVKAAADYVSSLEYGDGLVDIIEYYRTV